MAQISRDYNPGTGKSPTHIGTSAKFLDSRCNPTYNNIYSGTLFDFFTSGAFLGITPFLTVPISRPPL